MELLNYVGGQYLSPSSGEWIDVLAPVDGSVLARVPDSGADDVDRAVVAARTAFETTDWRHRTRRRGPTCCGRWPTNSNSRVPELSGTLIRDVGCPARLANAMQAFMPVMHLRAFADMAPLLDDPRSQYGAR